MQGFVDTLCKYLAHVGYRMKEQHWTHRIFLT